MTPKTAAELFWERPFLQNHQSLPRETRPVGTQPQAEGGVTTGSNFSGPQQKSSKSQMIPRGSRVAPKSICISMGDVLHATLETSGGHKF